MALGDKLRERRERKEREAAEAAHRQAIEEASEAATALHEAWEYAKLADSLNDVGGIVLKAGEVAYLTVDGVAFVEPKREPGQWVGRSSGTSIRVAKGVSYRVGGSRGTYQQGEEKPTPTDTGTFVITDRRCIFVGTKRTTEWAFSKLLAYDTEGAGTAFFNVSNRQKTTGVYFGEEAENAIDAVIAAAIAKFNGPDAHARFVDGLEAEYRYQYACWEALSEGREPPERPPELEQPDQAETGSPTEPATTISASVLPTVEDLSDALIVAGFEEAEGGTGFGIRHEGDRLKVFWLNADSYERDEQVPAMAKFLRDNGRRAKVARQDGYPYVSVTG